MYIMNPICVLTHHCSKVIEVSDPSNPSLTYRLSHQKKIRRPNHNHQDMLHDCAMKRMANELWEFMGDCQYEKNQYESLCGITSMRNW